MNFFRRLCIYQSCAMYRGNCVSTICAIYYITKTFTNHIFKLLRERTNLVVLKMSIRSTSTQPQISLKKRLLRCDVHS